MTEELFQQYTDHLPVKLLSDLKKEVSKISATKAQIKEILERTRKEYEDARISPGEAIGIITAESFGEPGTQMSVDFHERVIIKINDNIKILKIGEFVDSLIELKGSFKINNDSEIVPLNDLDIYVPSLNHDEKIEWKRVIECSRHIAPEKLVKITTASGRTITATDNHSFVTRISNDVVPIKGSELREGMRIPVLSYLPMEDRSKIDVKEFLKEDYIYENMDGLIETSYHAKPIPRFIKLNQNTGWFIGAYLAEGSANQGQVCISNLDDTYMNNAKEFVKGIGLDYKEDFHHRGFANSRDLKVSSSLLSKFIVNSCNKGSANKRVPNFAFGTSDQFIAGLLRGYFDGDGNFHVDRKMIRASSNSKELIDGIALLLSRFKIFSYKIKDKKGQHWLLIPYKYAPLFLAHIGSDIQHKRVALERLSEKSKSFWNSKSQDYTDMISGFGDLFYSTAKKLGYPTRYVNNFTKRQKIGRTALFRYMKLFEELAKKKNVDISNELTIMQRMFNSDVIWDSIEKIEYVDYNDEYVYDLSVPGLETFTTSEGIVTHNTLNVFHFAGVAEVNVTLGLPRLIEIFDARKEIATPAMEIYLKEPANKDASLARKAASMIKEKVLEEVVSEFLIDMVKGQVDIKLDRKKMSELGVNTKAVIEALTSSLKGVAVKEKDHVITLKFKDGEYKLNDIYKLKEKAKTIYIGGVEGIEQVLPVKKDDEFIVICSGSNLKDILKVNEVDETRTTTNNIFEVEAVLGIEAARQAITEEAKKVISEQGLEVDIRHIMLVADVMTNRGSIKGITRSGVTGEKESVLARASFETPIKHLVNASLAGEVDNLNSIIENIILNQAVPVGTGLPGLVTRMKKMDPEEIEASKKIKKEMKEEVVIAKSKKTKEKEE